MFTKLRIRNFQSLGDATLELGKITVIIGPSFLGKSAVVRSLRTLVRNRFEASFMKKGASFSQIELWEGDKWVQYNRTTNTEYRFSECPEAFTKIGRDVPVPIQEFLNMPEIQFDTDFQLDFNIQQQFDAPFIIGLSGHEAAKVFGKMMNLDIVVMSARQISNDIYAINKKKDAQQAIIDVSVDYIQEHYVVELKYSLLKEAMTLQESLEEDESNNERLLLLIADIETTEEEIRNYSAIKAILDEASLDTMLEPPNVLEELIVSLMQAEAEISTLGQLLLDTTFDDFDIVGLIGLEDTLISHELEITTIILFREIMNSLETVNFDAVAELQSISSLITSGNNLNEEYRQYREELSRADSDYTAKKAEFAIFIRDNGICPITKQPFTESCIKEIEGDV